MNIFIVSRGCPSEKYKMLGIFEFDQAKALRKLGNNVVFLALDMRSIRRKRKWGYRYFTKNSVDVLELNIPCGRLPKKLFYFIGKIGMRRLYKKALDMYGKPEVVHAHFTDTAYICSCIKDSSIPFIVTEHSSKLSGKIDNKTYKTAKKSYESADVVIGVSNCLCEIIRKEFTVQPLCVHNIVDIDSFKLNKERHHNKEFVFVSTGSLTQGKRMDLLVESFKELVTEGIDARLFIFGEGAERIKIEGIINRNNLNDKVFLMGLCERSRINKIMEQAQCFVLPSRSETFGVAYIEALAAGIPVIATRCGGPEDFVDDTNGLLIGIDNKDELVNAMIYMYNNIDLYNSDLISENAKLLFSGSTIAGQLLEVYSNAINNIVKGRTR